MGLLDDITTDASSKKLFTYQTIETPVNAVNSKDNVELLKKNGDLIGKYFKEFKDLFDKASKNEESKKQLDIDILNRLNEFAYNRDLLFADIPTVSVPLVWANEDLEKDKKIETTIAANASGLKSDKAYKQLSAIEQAAKNDEKPDDNELDRSLSLTYGEVRKGDEWFAKHRKKYHKQRLNFLKKNPFAGGASPVAGCYWKWMSCSIGTSCDIVCKECEKKYLKAEEDLAKAEDFYDKYKEDNKSIINDPRIQQQLKNMKKNIDTAAKEKDRLHRQAYFELRGLDE